LPPLPSPHRSPLFPYTTLFRSVITDFSMPGMNGLDLAIALKAKAPRQPVMLLTAYAVQLESDPPPGIDKLLEKPISIPGGGSDRSEEHTSELQSRSDIVCRLLL